MSKQKRSQVAIANELERARHQLDTLLDDTETKRGEVRNLEEEYSEAVADEVIALLRAVEWTWPGKRGQRAIEAVIPPSNRIVTLTKPIRSGRYQSGFTIRCAHVTLVERSWQEGYRLCLSYSSAKLIGIVKHANRKDWSKIRRELEKAGITDEGKLAELLKKRGE